MEFHLTTWSTPDEVVVAAFGDIDMRTAPALQERIGESFDEGTRNLVVDLTGVDFLDSSGLGAIAATRAHAVRVGARLTVICPNPNILRLFEITGMDRVLRIVPAAG